MFPSRVLPSLLLLVLVSTKIHALAPVVIIPGVVSSILEAKLTNATHLPFGCRATTQDWYTIWVSSAQTFGRLGCMGNHMTLNYNTSSQCAVSKPGVNMRVKDYGNVTCCDVLNPQDTLLPKIAIFQPFSDFLRKNGYQDGTTLRAAPYDFRLYGDPCFNIVYFTKLKTIIEQTYNNQNQQRVVLISHSMGGPVIHQFLASSVVTPEWKAMYIARFIAIASPFSGAPEGLREYITGQVSAAYGNWIPGIIADPVSIAFRSWPATISLLPMETTNTSSVRNRAWDNITLVSTPSQNYTGTNYGQNVADVLTIVANTSAEAKLGIVYWTQQERMRQNVLNKGPGVLTNCLYLTDVNTPIGAVFADDTMTKQTEVLYGSGDGTVAAVSTRASCQEWRERKMVVNEGFDVTLDSFALGKHVNHHTILGAKEILERVGILLEL